MNDEQSNTQAARGIDALEQMMARLMLSEQLEHEARAKGLPALRRLADIGLRDSGQSRHVRRLLLGLYSGSEWPFDLSRLRCLDVSIQQDALAVIALATYAGVELHTQLSNGQALLEHFWAEEGGNA